jgi:hypothetical protein
MVRKSCFILGLALALSWWIGLSRDHGATVLWFNAVAAVLSFGIGALVDESSRRPSHAAGPVVLGLGMGALYLAGTAAHQPLWANVLNLMFAIAFLAVAVVSAGVHHRLAFAHPRRRR